MTLANALSLWDWPTALGLVIVGLVIGYVLVPMAWPVETVNFPVRMTSFLTTVIGTVFFILIFTVRALAGVPNIERILTSALQWVVFSVSISAGLKLRDRMTVDTGQ